jgi:rubredoxin
MARRGSVSVDWVADSAVDECEDCRKRFGLLRRKVLSNVSLSIKQHHCRHCGHVFCDECAADKAQLPPEFGYTTLERVCKKCFQTLNQNTFSIGLCVSTSTLTSLQKKKPSARRTTFAPPRTSSRAPPSSSWVPSAPMPPPSLPQEAATHPSSHTSSQMTAVAMKALWPWSSPPPWSATNRFRSERATTASSRLGFPLARPFSSTSSQIFACIPPSHINLTPPPPRLAPVHPPCRGGRLSS